MNKYRTAVVLAGVIISFTVFYAVYYVAEIEGQVYTISGQDTMYLEDVSVQLLIRAPETNRRGVKQRNVDSYSATTDKNGYFLIKVSGLPYRINCRYTFLKQEYNKKEIYKSVLISNHTNITIELNPSHGNPVVETEGDSDDFNRIADSKVWSIMIPLILGVISLFLFWMFFPFRFFVDKFRNMRNRGFKGLSKSKQEAFFKDGFCESCKDYMGMTYESEETKLGMTFMYGPCDSCGKTVKVRIK